MTSMIRLVLVEDAEADAELIARHLKRAQLECEIHRVQTEPTFIAALRDVKPDLILSDFSMPQFDGLRALQIASTQARDTPFIFVSGTIGEERAIDALHRGATDYVLKSNLSRLAAAVQRALREAALKTAQRQAEQQLRENEQRLRDTVETSQDWIWEIDAEGRFRFCSGAVETILGYEPVQLIGRRFRDYLHDDEQTRAAPLLPPAGQGVLTGAVACWRSADGQLRWLERNAVAILDASRQVIGFRGTDRDITVRREQEARLRRLTRTYRMLSSTGSAILRLRERGELLDEVCRIAVQQGGYERVVISLADPGSKGMRPRAWAGTDLPELRAFDRVWLGAAAAGRVLAGTPLVNNDLAGARGTRDAHEDAESRDTLLRHGYRAFAALPLSIDGTSAGTITLFSMQRGVFDRAELQVLQELTANLSFALQYLEKDEAVQFLSYYDSLTGLAKRPLFCQRLTAQLAGDAADTSSVVVVFDVQQLGAINDSYGRYIGDELIGRIAARLRESHGNESSAHFGGGTFAMLSRSAGRAGETGRLLQNAAARLFVEPFRVEGLELRPAVRAGVAVYPHDGATADLLVQNAEAALKAAREDNERYLLYGMIRQRPTSRSLALEARLAGALDRNEFLLHYQPKVDLVSGVVTGLEALLRWQDAQDGLVPPSLFVPMLERSGTIVEVGEWVVHQALRDLQRWAAAGTRGVRVAVNVSPLQLRRRDFVERLLASVQPSGRDHPLIDIEITESMLMQDIELSIRKLGDLRAAGVGVAIDDFGTGYSSLRLLSRLPVDTLKVDRSFVQDVEDEPRGIALVSNIVSLARAFGMRAVAEGVETAAQADALRCLQCPEAQGYFFGRPIAAAEVPAMVARLSQSAAAEVAAGTQAQAERAVAKRDRS
jgi:PAS domain S-box-containing protein/diguanylate cyclase (GGDEF)-like protein